MLEGIDVDKHPGTQGREWTCLYPRQKMKQGVDLTKYLLLHSLIPSNITFQHWWGLQGRCTPALPTAKIGRSRQPGLWGKPFELYRQVYRNLASGLWCDYWSQLTYRVFPHENQRELAMEEKVWNSLSMDLGVQAGEDLWPERYNKNVKKRKALTAASRDFHSPEVISL